MNLLEKIASLFIRSADDHGFWIYVRCNRCGEKLRARVDLFSDLTVRYGEGGVEDVYYTRKTLIGSSLCFQPIEATLTFDLRRQLVGKEITGGEFITKEEFEAQE
jgi:hypothetical protein